MLRDFFYFDLDGGTREIEDINMYFSLRTISLTICGCLEENKEYNSLKEYKILKIT